MFTVAGWSQSITSTALINLNAVADPHLTISGADIRIPPFAPKLLALYPMGVNLARAQLVSPSLRSFVPFDYAPVDQAATPSSVKTVFGMWDNPYELVVNEPLNLAVANVAAGANIARGIVFLGDGPQSEINGEILTVRATGTTACVAETWTNVALTFGNTLPAGRYAIVGMRAESTTCIAARLVLPGYGHRPGCIGNPTVNGGFTDPFRFGNLGKWGEFTNTVPPTADFLCTAADAAQTVFLDLMQIG